MNKQVIVTTTINKPTKALMTFISKKNYDVVVVGDRKTPHQEYQDLEKKYTNFKYLLPAEQELLSRELSDAIGWNCIQRRNMGFLYAYQKGYEVIGSFDDDNILSDSWDGRNLIGVKSHFKTYYNPNCNALDPFSALGDENGDAIDYHHRGFPLEWTRYAKDTKEGIDIQFEVLVHVPIPYGDPDIDAVTRIMKAPFLSEYEGGPFSSHQIMPFNSQCTFIARKLLPYYFMLIGVGRHDDILGAYLLQKRMKEEGYDKPFIVFDNSIARQDRNEHDLTKDLEKEIFGYCNSGKYIDSPSWRDVLPIESLQVYDIYTKEMEKYK
jgi:hypothetical protein